MPQKLISSKTRRTHPLIWFAAIICTILSIAVIIAGIAVFIGYMIIHPRVPYIDITNAHLDMFQYDMAGLLEIQVTIFVKAENDNAKAHASFSDTSFILRFQGREIAEMVATPFEVSKNSSQELKYEVHSSFIALNPAQMEELDLEIKQNVISFNLKGSSGARWRVGLLGSVKFLCQLDCQLKFHPLNGTYLYSPCSSRAK